MIHPWILFLSVVSAVVCALIAMHASRRCAMHCEDARQLAAALRSVRSKIEGFASDIDALADGLATLRGKFYAERRKSPLPNSNGDASPEATSAAGPVPGNDPAQTLAWKQQMRAKLGLIPSRN